MSHLNLPERIHIQWSESKVLGREINPFYKINTNNYWDDYTQIGEEERKESFNKFTKVLTAKWVDTTSEAEKPSESILGLKNHYMGGAKELADIAIIQNPQGNVYYHKKSDVEEMQILKEKVALTMYGLI